MKLETTLDIPVLINASNIAEHLTKEELTEIGSKVVQHFEHDLDSRTSWEKRTEASLKLALQVAESKNFPWPNASNVKFPLITVAALQYHARSYPVLLDNEQPVKCRVMGEDPDGTKRARAERVENHMSFQITEEDEDWEAEMDKVLITQPIIGCAFKKTYYDPIKKHNISENVLAKDLVVNYWTKSLEDAPRVTHVLQMSRNEIYERVSLGLWCDVSEGRRQEYNFGVGASNLQLAKDKAQGITPPEPSDPSTPIEILEQHCYIDFDNDGYEEPYIVYVRRDTGQVARIVARYNHDGIKYSKSKPNEVQSITAEHYFTKYPFIPSPDGGFYDLGFGVLLGPLNESINTIINQLVDAGTLANTAGGFFSRGVKIRGGNATFNPMEWKHVDSTGDDLRKGIVPLPVREPSNVLFTLLNLLIGYGERVGSSVDILTGQNPGQNTPAETTRIMAEQGLKIFSGIFKRTYRSLKQEYRKLYRLNQLYITKTTQYVKSEDGDKYGVVLVEDYSGSSSDVMPTADPNVSSDSHKMMQAQGVISRTQAAMGSYNKYEAEKYFLKAMKVQSSDIDTLLPDPKGPHALPPFVHPKVQIEQMKEEGKKAERDLKMKLGLLDIMAKVELIQAEIQKLEAEAEAIRIGVATEAEKLRISEINTQIAMQRERRDGMLSVVKTMNDVYSSMKEQQLAEREMSMEGQAAPPKA